MGTLWGKRLAAVVLALGTLGVAAAPTGRAADKESLEDAAGDLIPVLNVGGHSGAISDMALGPFGNRLFTVGRPGEVSEWDLHTGERFRVWRFPRPAHHLAYWRRGKEATLAVSTQHPNTRKAALWLVDLHTGEVRRGPVTDDGKRQALAFSPDGERLAASRAGAVEIFPLKGKTDPLLLTEAGESRSLAFDKTGQWLLSARHRPTKNTGEVQVWNLSGKDKPKAVALTGAQLEDPKAVWSHEGKRIVVINGGTAPGVFVWTFDGAAKLFWKVDGDALSKVLGGGKGVVRYPVGVSIGSAQAVTAAWDNAGRLELVQIDRKTKIPRLLPTDIRNQHERTGLMAVTPNGRWLAATMDPAFRIALYDLEKQKEVRRLGPSVRVPRVVAWTPDSRGVAWGYHRPAKNWQRGLVDGMSLTRLEHLSGKEVRAATAEELPKGWSIKVDDGKATLSHDGKTVTIGPRGVLPLVRSYKNPAGKMRLLVPYGRGTRLAVVDPDTGKAIGYVGNHLFSRISDLAVSPDQKHLVVAGGDLSLEVYALGRVGPPLLEILGADGGDWVVWSQQGYYAGSPGGEKLIGWQATTSPDRAATFYPAATFRKKLYRPDVIQKVLDSGSVEAALKKLVVKTRGVEDVRPPHVTLSVVQNPRVKSRVVVQATAESTVAGQPVEMLRLLVDGRPLPDKQGVMELSKGQKKVTAKWTIPDLPGGRLELKVRARCPDVSGVSAPRVVIVPSNAKNQPTLHVLAVGINYADSPGLRLNCAVNDAEVVSRAFSDACTGKDNLFRQDGPPQKLLEQKATRAGVLAALAELRKKKLKPQDLVVFYYAGHGVRQGREFYLLTHSADLKKLAKTALSGSQLREAFTDMPCQVLLLLDACHSGAAARGLLGGFKAATDAASRQLADEECGVTLLAAAMGYEKAEENGSNGLFAQGLLKALGKAKSLPYNRRDGRQYVHHLYSYVFDEVKARSEDRQHPFLILPWTTDSFAIRQLTTAVEEDP